MAEHRSTACGGSLLGERKIHEDTGEMTDMYCKIHPSNHIQFFCREHDCFLCILCKYVSHKNCHNRCTIEEASENGCSRDDVQRLLDECVYSLSHLNRLAEERNADLASVTMTGEENIKKVKTLRKQVNATLDQLETSMIEKITEVVQIESSKILEHLSSLKHSIAVLEGDIERIRKASEKALARDMFVAIKLAEIRSAHTVYSEIRSESRLVDLKYKAHESISSLIALKEFGTLKRRTASRYSRSEDMECYLRTMPVSRVTEYTSREAWHSRTCASNKALFTPDDRLLLCDSENWKLKMLDEQFKLISSVKFHAEPCDVVLIDKEKACVSLPKSKELQFVSLNPCMQLADKVNMNIEVRGIAVRNGKLFAICNSVPPAILVCDLEGNVLKKFDKLILAENITTLSHQSYIDVDKAGRIHLSNVVQDKVVCLTPEGDIAHVYGDEDLEGPRQLVADEDGYGYVVCENSSNIQIVSPDGRKYMTLVSRNVGLQSPRSMAFRSSDRSLIVGQAGNDEFVVFRFQEEKPILKLTTLLQNCETIIERNN